MSAENTDPKGLEAINGITQLLERLDLHSPGTSAQVLGATIGLIASQTPDPVAIIEIARSVAVSAVERIRTASLTPAIEEVPYAEPVAIPVCMPAKRRDQRRGQHTK